MPLDLFSDLPYEVDWSFHCGMLDGVDDVTPDSEDVNNYILNPETLTGEQRTNLGTVYPKGYEGGQELRTLPTHELRHLLLCRLLRVPETRMRERAEEYLNAWNDNPDAWPEGTNAENRERDHYLEGLTDSTANFRDDLECYLDRDLILARHYEIVYGTVPNDVSDPKREEDSDPADSDMSAGGNT